MASTRVGFISDAEMEKLSTQSKGPVSVSRAPAQVNPGFISDDEMMRVEEQSKSNEISEVDSAARGAAQGLTFGFADEVSGGIEALWEKAKGDPATFGNLYKQKRDESRANFKAAEKENPSAYLAGEVGGSIASAAIPLGAATTLGRAALTGARAGALSSLGNSEGETVKQIINDTGKGAMMGGAGGFAFKAAPKIASWGMGKIGSKTSNVASKASPSLDSGSMKIMGMETPEVISDGALSIKNRIKSYWNPDVDPKWNEFQDIAKRNGIDPKILPEAVKFGPDSSASRASRSLAEGKFGEETLKKFNESLGQVRGAYNKKITDYSQGLPTDEVSAGKILRDSYDEGVSKFFDQMDFTHNTVMGQAPGLRLTPQSLEKIESSISGIEKFAKGRLQRGVTDTQRKQGQQLLNAVESIRAGNGSYKQTVEALRDIGEAAFQSKNSLADVPVDVQKMRKIYNDLNSGLIDTVRSNLGDDVADSLVSNNKAMSEFFSETSLVSRIMGDKAIAPEQAFKSLILSGDSQRLQALKKVLPQEKWNYLKGAVLENLAKRDPEGDFTFKQLYSAMRSKKSAIDSIFEPSELDEALGIVRLGDRFGSPVLSSSGTGASLSFSELSKIPANLTVDAIAINNAKKATKTAAEKAGEKLTASKSESIGQKLGQLSKKPIESLPRAAGVLAGSSDVIKKGPEKWANDGAEKIKKTDASISPELIDELKKTKQGKDLLIRASDLKSGSTQMDKLILKIKTSYKNGGE